MDNIKRLDLEWVLLYSIHIYSNRRSIYCGGVPWSPIKNHMIRARTRVFVYLASSWTTIDHHLYSYL